MKTNYFTDRNSALDYLLDKYQVVGKANISDCGCLGFEGKKTVLFPWRVERRFVELKNLIENGTLEDVSTFRFAHLVPVENKRLDELIYQELDICEWLGNSKVSRLFAVYKGDNAVNIIVKLQNDISCSIECSVMLPSGSQKIDRHEIIARRGVASDQVVDTQVPQSSIYAYTNEKDERFTDVDAEIFGLSSDDVNIVRAAFKVMSTPELAEEWQEQDKHLKNLIDNAKRSEVEKAASKVEGGK